MADSYYQSNLTGAQVDQCLQKILDGSLATEPPDWSQNDPAAPSYVKNRTHWIESGRVTVLEPTEFSYTGGNAVQFDVSLGLIADLVYYVDVNGTEYTITAVDNGTYVRLAASDWTFAIDDFGSYFAYLPLGGSASVILGIETFGAVVHKLPLMYLPIPAPTAADAGKVLRVKSDGSGYELAAM